MVRIVNNKSAYSLVEVLVSILILLIITVGILEALKIYTLTSLEITLRKEATNLARSCIEDLHTRRHCFGISTCNSTTCNGTYTYKIRNFSHNFQIVFTNPNNISSNGTRISVKVTYKYRGKEREVSMNSFVIPN